ncbi:MAG: hypothetical protein QOD32_288 [Pyrinomonadaceae bacterium]|jgi:hypothetical protein|nr:hypothetical protein [Pyrinomonadaceae bacterium]
MSKPRTAFIVATALVASLLAIPVTSAQTTAPDVQLSGVEWQPIFSYISGARFNADKSGRLEDDYFGYPQSRPFPYEESKGAPYLPQQGYNLIAKVTNNETKTIRAVVWEVTYFKDADKTQTLACRTTSLLGHVSPGKTKTLRQTLSAGKFKTTPYSTANLLRVDYTDNTAWLSSDLLKIKSGERRPCGS